MPTVTDLVTTEEVERLAQPAQAREGERLLEKGAVKIKEMHPGKVSATVKSIDRDDDIRDTELIVSGDRLAWKCSCTSSELNFCKHLVAAALQARQTTSL